MLEDVSCWRDDNPARSWRTSREVSVDDLAERVGIDADRMKALELGQTRLSHEECRTLSEVMSISALALRTHWDRWLAREPRYL